ncbi:MAG: hypothetical protein ACE5DO_05595 [Desulfobacterales bacterium]
MIFPENMQNLKNRSLSQISIILIFLGISAAVHSMMAEASGLSAAKNTSYLKSPEEFSSEPKLSKGKLAKILPEIKGIGPSDRLYFGDPWQDTGGERSV